MDRKVRAVGFGLSLFHRRRKYLEVYVRTVEAMTITERMHRLIWPRCYKTVFMLSSAEHEIFSAYKYENANSSWHFHIY